MAPLSTPPFISFLKKVLENNDLPGLEAQMKMAPIPLGKSKHRRRIIAPDDAHASSVLVLLFPDQQDGLKVILTLRNRQIHHGGEISFPGGRAEYKETPVETALRETKEEIGIASGTISVIGRLSNIYVEVSNNNIIPVVGFLDHPPSFALYSGEVEDAFSIPLETLMIKDKFVVENWTLHDSPFRVPYWNVYRVPLWGATAMILNELLAIYRMFKEETPALHKRGEN